MYVYSSRCVENAHPVAIKLNQLLEKGKIPEDCLYYKFIDNTTSSALVDPKSASDFTWDRDVCEFFDTIKYLGGSRTRNFVRGPGFFGTGRGGLKEFNTFSDFNLCGPSTNSSKRFQAGYTTASGVIKPHLLSLYSFAFNRQADLPALVSTDKLNVIPLSQAIDGTALKPGLEYDSLQKMVVGLTTQTDQNNFSSNSISDPEEIKKKLLTSAEVVVGTSLDNGSSIPVGVYYRPKSVTGEEILKSIQDTAKTLQTCQMCLKLQASVSQIVSNDMPSCFSSCDECLKLKSVCSACKQNGQVSHIPSLRACNRCLEKGLKCNRFLAATVITDCEECNKKALSNLHSMAEDGTLPIELSLLVALPDVVQLGKSMKCSWANWFIDLEGAKSSLVLIRTLRDSAGPDVRKKLRKMLTLDCVRNKDRMAVEPIVRLTRTSVLEVLRGISLVVHTIVPEKYRFWKSNQSGICKRPIAIESGAQGKVLVLDYDFESQEARLVELRLHQPVDVHVRKETFKDARDLCFTSGIVFVSERGSGAIRVIDLEGKVRLKPEGLKSRAELLSQLSRFSLSQDGTVPILRKRLATHLKALAAQVKNPEIIQLNTPLVKPTSICVASTDILLCADDEHQRIIQLEVSCNGVAVVGTSMREIHYPDGVSSIESLCVWRGSAYLATSGNAGGLYDCDLANSNVKQLLQNSSDSCSEIKRLCHYGDVIVFTDIVDRKVKTFDPKTSTVKTLMGTGKEGTNDGTGETCTFAQVHGICSFQNTILVSDVAAGTVKIVSPLTGTVSFLQALGKLYDSFGIGAHTVDAVSLSLQDAVNNVSSVNEYIKSTVATVKQHYNMKEAAATNGPQGTVSKKTQVSLELLEQGMARLQNNLKNINEDYVGDVDLRTLLTTIVENLHAVSHFKNETFTALQYARDFGTIAKESLKRTTKWSAKYFTHDKSFYPVPTSSMELADVEVMKSPTAARIDPLIEVAMKELVDKFRPVRQRTVRSETTKDKAGALPPAVYYNQPPHTKVMFHNDPTVEGEVMEQITPHIIDDDGDSHAPSITFVDDSTIEIVAVVEVPDQEDEYDTDSGTDVDDDDHDSYPHTTTLTRSGRAIRLDL